MSDKRWPIKVVKRWKVLDIDSRFFWAVVLDEPGLPTSILGIGKDGTAAVEGKENADLVAAAPELYEACKEFQEALLLGDENGTIIRPVRQEQLQEMIAAALAKAEGRA